MAGQALLVVDCAARILHHGGRAVRCAIGRGGAIPATAKREGDGATPIGAWPILGALLRRDRGFQPPAALPWRWIRADDGWSDDPEDPAYNRPVRHPHPFSAEHLWRDDGLYDVILVTGHNGACVAGMGSAIFVHLASGDFRATAGCVAIAAADMVALLAGLEPGTAVQICAG